MTGQACSPQVENQTLPTSTLTARLALEGFRLDVADDGPSGESFRVSGPGGRRTFDSLREVEDFANRMRCAS